jgi:hypothetical protein
MAYGSIRFLVAFLLVMFAGMLAHAQGTVFLGAIEDVPLMPGLSEAVDDGMVFESPSGRIAEARASGPVTRRQVLDFYAATLPQLGWERETPGRYRREGEILRIEFGDGDSPDLGVRFALAPAP